MLRNILLDSMVLVEGLALKLRIGFVTSLTFFEILHHAESEGLA
jgi:hypothetical protein